MRCHLNGANISLFLFSLSIFTFTFSPFPFLLQDSGLKEADHGYGCVFKWAGTEMPFRNLSVQVRESMPTKCLKNDVMSFSTLSFHRVNNDGLNLSLMYTVYKPTVSAQIITGPIFRIQTKKILKDTHSNVKSQCPLQRCEGDRPTDRSTDRPSNASILLLLLLNVSYRYKGKERVRK